MDNIDKYIDKLFEEKLSNASLNPNVGGKVSSNEWMRISKALRKRSFLKFSWYNFNIYYLSTIIVASTVAGFIVTPKLFPLKEEIQNPVQTEQNESFIVSDTSNLKISSDTLIIESVINEKEVSHDSLKKQKSQQTNNITDEKVVNQEDSLNFKKKATNNVIQKNSVDNSKEFNKEEIVVDDTKSQELNEKRDTIVNIDTVLINKKRLLFKRKK